MELCNFIKQNNIETFENLKNILEKEPFYLKIKEDTDFPNLFLIHNQEKSDFNLKIVNECNGIILDKNNLKILCYTFDKCSCEDFFPKNINKNELYVEHAVSGSLIRVFFYNEKWIVSTKKCIDASKAKWMSKKNYYELFYECIEESILIHYLKKNFCYSFILDHPDNNIFKKNDITRLYHISSRNMDTLCEVIENIGVMQLNKIFIEENKLENLYIEISNTTNVQYEGIIFIDNYFNRWKLTSPYIKKLKKIWGNTNDRFRYYLELRKDHNRLLEYLTYFDEDKNIFLQYEQNISNFAYVILQKYILKHIQKVNKVVPYYFSKIIYKIHGDYFKTKNKTNHDKVMLALLELTPNQILFMMKCHAKIIEEINYDTTYLEIN